MGITVRHYLFPDEGAEPQRLSHRVVSGLVAGTDTMPQFAGTRQKMLEVLLENTDGKPERIFDILPAVWVFDETGAITEGLRDALTHAMNAMPDYAAHRDSTVVPLGPALSKKQLATKYRWSPTKADLDAVTADIWSQDGKRRLKDAAGTQPKRPQLSWEAKAALTEAREPFWKICHAIDELKEPSLVGFIHETRERSDEYDYGPLYKALADLAERRLQNIRRRKKKSGTWYALVEVLRWKDHVGELVASFHERCEGRQAATEAARRLLAQHADKLSHDTTVEAAIETDLEWEAAARQSTGN